MTYLKIAWRNLIKRPTKTIILLMAIGVGLFCILFFQGVMDGFYIKMIDNVVDTSLGHLQVNQKDFRLKRDAKYYIKDPEKVIKAIENAPHVVGFSPRVVAQGLISSAEKSHFATIYGINLEREKSVTKTVASLESGKPVTVEDTKGILIGEAMAKKLKVGIGDKVVIMLRNLDGDMEGAALRVRGIYNAATEEFEKMNVYVSIREAQKLLGLGNGIHQVAIRVDKSKNAPVCAAYLKNHLEQKDLLVQTWAQLEPVLKQQVDMSSQSMLIFYVIVFVALAFGIINSFLMEIFERIKEFGIMMSLGTRPINIFWLLIYESVFLGVLGAVLGGILSVVIMGWFFHWQLNFAHFARGLEFFGFGSVVPLMFDPGKTAFNTITLILSVVVATIYPAVRAARFKPIEALRHV